ncbi:hypothetical protein [Actinophytocola sp.]
MNDLTIENYAYLISKHIRLPFGRTALGDIHKSDIQHWSADLHACGY